MKVDQIEEKVFRVDVQSGTVEPTSHTLSLSKQEQVRWEVSEGSGIIVFDPRSEAPVSFSVGPVLSSSSPATATPVAPHGSKPHTHFICCWRGEGANEEVVVVPAELIIDP
ncbi:MAG: hypothetical protein GF328_13995 [Candidatus Latescibacteria bacterium]|nr:hypothetical protein [Candidatus Latescibacterota bacterium]